MENQKKEQINKGKILNAVVKEQIYLQWNYF